MSNSVSITTNSYRQDTSYGDSIYLDIKEIINIIIRTPNDQELGQLIRELYTKKVNEKEIKKY